MSKRLSLALLCLILCSANVFAQDTPAPQIGLKGNKPGDIIAPTTDGQIANWCDFNKQIVRAIQSFMCSYVGDKGNTVLTGS